MVHIEHRDRHQHFYQYKPFLEMIDDHDLTMEVLRLPEHVGEGEVRRLILRGGMELCITEYRMRDERVTTFKGSEALVELNYCLEGGGLFEVSGRRFEVKPNEWQLLLMKDLYAVMKHEPDRKMHFLGIRMKESDFREYVGAGEGEEATAVPRLRGAQPFYAASRPMTPEIGAVVRELAARARQETMPRLYMESKTLELLLLSLRQYFLPEDGGGAKSILRGNDLDKIKRAQAVLRERMDSPPTLLQLARLVGLNDNKLKLGFKEVFGNTVFGVLREMRLEQAKLCLEQGTMNVSETAYAVGYSNPGHFAEAFRRKYGIQPHTLLHRAKISV
ncbi:helix-turn-helix domain-containing protein [Cohnella sp. LGH]|uniref:AraC family transcriptional regulator n=1 Tax=Cohnella sp. LGH TaxID=1619153 RepID=UPI001ADB545D|nr:AraC family transcriptional regulator [Cohnella sp. LGH]QTH40155.1 helix-turn-helix domain-containing protein [Cohnella sp. LGH]